MNCAYSQIGIVLKYFRVNHSLSWILFVDVCKKNFRIMKRTVFPIVLFAMMLILGQRNYLTMTIVAVCADLVIFCAFKFLLQIEMPMGFLDGLF